MHAASALAHPEGRQSDKHTDIDLGEEELKDAGLCEC